VESWKATRRGQPLWETVILQLFADFETHSVWNSFGVSSYYNAGDDDDAVQSNNRLEFTAAANDLSILLEKFHRRLTCPWSCAHWRHSISSTLP